MMSQFINAASVFSTNSASSRSLYQSVFKDMGVTNESLGIRPLYVLEKISTFSAAFTAFLYKDITGFALESQQSEQ